MKKLLLFIFALTSLTISKANPIESPSIAISELAFDSDGKWIIELQGFNMNPNFHLDSIFIESSTGIAKLKRFSFDGISNIIIVRNDSLFSNLTVNQAGDSIKLHYYFNQFNFSIYKPALVYGNFKTALFYSPKKGQTLSGVPYFKYSSIYSIDKSPTIGLENDSVGMCGTIKGYIYDKNNQLVTGNDYVFIDLNGWDFNITENGSYSRRIYSNKNNISDLQFYFRPKMKWYYIKISPVDLSIQPDTMVTVDIHLLESLVTGIDEIKSEQESVFHVSPNPIKELALNYEISIPIKSSNCYIELIGLNGQRIAKFPITEDTGRINLPRNTVNGLYTLRLFVNNKNYATSKIVITK